METVSKEMVFIFGSFPFSNKYPAYGSGAGTADMIGEYHMTSKPKTRLRFGVLENGVYKKTVRGSAHFLRKPPGIALEVSDIDGIRQHNGNAIEVKDSESGRVYSVDFAHFCRHASEPFNRGYGWQRFLTFSHWTVTQGKRKITPLPIDQTPAFDYSEPPQMILFE